jgi:subtilisin family serine protease
MVELDAPPVAAVYAEARASTRAADASALAALTQAHLRTLEAAQARLAEQLAAVGAQEIYRVQRVYNGVAVRVASDRLDEIAALPGVKAVHPLIAKRPTNARSVPYIGAPALWSGLAGAGDKLTGQGMRIAVIDTGVDYLHTDFGGPGGDYGDNDPTIIGDAPNFPGVKIAGGYDFAGKKYNADPNADPDDYQPIPAPDPDPMDCYGHGTHVTGTAAGYGVNADGSRYSGPYGAELDFDGFRIGPGVAPEAKIYALKVFGCSGATELTAQAIEWAVDPNGDGDLSDRMDVINMSLGSSFGSLDDPSAVASDNAARMGVIVVASAGNTGDVYFSTGSPAVADRAVSVAAVGLPDPTPGAEALLSDFSARGPRTPDSALKPDVAAPGQDIVSARSVSGDRSLRLSGTSMAAPHVAGAMALLRQARPDWSVEEMKALVMNSARFPAGRATNGSGAAYGPTRTGAGVIDLGAAMETTILAYSADAPGAVSLSFGAPEILEQTTITRTLRLVNKGDTPRTVTLGYDAIVDQPGVTITLGVTTPITLAAGASVDAPVRMTARAAALKHTRDPSTEEVQTLPRHWLGEETGFVTVTLADGGPALHTPLHAAPRPASDLGADGPLDFGDAREAEVTLEGEGVTGENPPLEWVSLASAFELAYARSDLPGPAAGEIFDPLAYGDLRYVGVTSDYPLRASVDETILYFGVATLGNWSSSSRLKVSVYIDADGDGRDDYRLFNASEDRYTDDGHQYSDAFVHQYSDAFVTVVEDLETGGFSRRSLLNMLSSLAYDLGVYNTNVMVLPVYAADIGLVDGESRFRYRVETEVAELENQVHDATSTLVYDAARPGLDLFSGNPGAPMMAADDGAPIDARLDVGGYGTNRSGGLLLLYLHNRSGAHAELVPLRLNLPERSYLPVVGGIEN